MASGAPRRDNLFMQTARKIATVTELGEIALKGAGFVVDPWNRRWHAAACPHVQRMTIGQPKWFAPTPAARDAYLRQRAATYPTAKPISACQTCGDSAGTSGPAARGPRRWLRGDR